MIARSIVIALSFLTVPVSAFAALDITEIMYDLPGTDTGREWIEVVNLGEDPVDLSTWKLFEEGTNHKLTHSSGPATVGAGEYAIIADDPQKFLADNPGFSGPLFGSAFSLKNTGEILSLKDPEGNEMESVTYSSEWGGDGDGNSLQHDSSWGSALPTPGRVNDLSVKAESGGSSSASSSGGKKTGSSSSSSGGPVILDLGGDRTVVVGTSVTFDVTTRGNTSGLRLQWNLGNGQTAVGSRVTTSYDQLGDYTVSVFVFTAQNTEVGSDRLKVTVVPPQANGEETVSPTSTSDNEEVASIPTAAKTTPEAQSPRSTPAPKKMETPTPVVELSDAMPAASAVALSEVGASGEGSNQGITPWLFALAALIGMGVIASVFFRGPKTVHGYTVVEETDRFDQNRKP